MKLRTPIQHVQRGNLTASEVSRIDSSNFTPAPRLRGARSRTRIIAFCTLLISLLGGNAGRAALFLDLTSVTPGGPGAGVFSGTLGGITVSGSIAGSPSVFSFNATGAGISNSTTDGTSPQYSYSTVFSPTAATTDRVGFSYIGGATNTVSISFSSPVTNPVFHVANLDNALFNFGATTGLTSMTLLKGNNGADSDGIDPAFGGAGFGFLLLQDANPSTSDATLPISTPPISGARSGYGSVQLNGTFSTITFGVGAGGPGADINGGSFTVSIVPEPGSVMLAGLGALGMVGFTRRRRR